MSDTQAFLAQAIRHALNDDECSDWFVRAHDPRGEFADRDAAVGSGADVFSFDHAHSTTSERERNNG